MIAEKNYNNLDNIMVGSREMLTLMGYESEKLIRLDRKVKVHNLAVAEEALRKYNNRKPNNL
jgi:hypothetical protein